MSFTESLQTVVEENENGLLSKHVSWERIRLGDVCDILNGFAFSSSGFNDSEGIPLLRIRDVTKSETQTRFVGEFDPQYLVANGDLLIGMDGDFNAALWSGSEALLNQRVCKLTPDEQFYSKSLLAYAIQGYLDAVNAKTSAITVKHLSSRTVSDIPLPLPPISEQSRIVNFLDGMLTRLDDAVASLERVQRNLERYRASVLKAAVEGRLVPTEAELARKEGRDYEPASELLQRILAERKTRWIEDAVEKAPAKGVTDEAALLKARKQAERTYKEPQSPDLSALQAQAGTTDLPDLPEGWCWAAVEQLASARPRSIQSGPFGSSLLHSEFQDTGKLVIGIDNVQDGVFATGADHRISQEKYEELIRFRARPEDVLITVMGTIGRCCVVPNGIEPAIITKHVYRVSVDQDLILPAYLLMSLRAESVVRYQMFGQVRGQTRPGLNGTIIKGLAIPLPPLGEQQRIAERVEQLSANVDVLRAQMRKAVSRSTRLRQSILKWAFEGKLVEQDPNDEPASVLLERIQVKREMNRAESN